MHFGAKAAGADLRLSNRILTSLQKFFSSVHSTGGRYVGGTGKIYTCPDVGNNASPPTTYPKVSGLKN